MPTRETGDSASAPAVTDGEQAGARPPAGRPHQAARPHRAFGGLVVVVSALAAFQNLFRLSVAPPLSDEQTYADMGWAYLHWTTLSQVQRLPKWSNFEHPPLAKILFGVAESLAGHPSVEAARVVAALFTLGTSAVLFWWIGKGVNRWVGLLAGGAYALIPMSVYPQNTRFGRSAMLDSVAAFFALVAVALAWHWFASTARRAWVLSAATGVCVGLATASKETAFLGALGPVALGMALVARRRAVWSRVAQAGGATALALITFLVTYLPFGDPAGRIRYLMRFQSDHSAQGHLVGFDGRVSLHPPWWTNLWFAKQGLGSVLAWALLAAVLAALVLRRDRWVAWLAAGLVGPFVFHGFVAKVTLPFYWVMWMPLVVALAALGMWELLLRTYRADRASRSVAYGAAAALGLVILVVASVSQVATLGSLTPVGGAAIAAVRADLGLRGEILTAGTYESELRPYLPDVRFLTAVPGDLSRVDLVVVGQPRCRTLVDPAVRALVASNLSKRSLRLVLSDRLVRAYEVVAPLSQPTQAEILDQPVGSLAEHC
jgi:4-amino-4-deoxy-L-arabinose transferase-like glycosyltransferase